MRSALALALIATAGLMAGCSGDSDGAPIPDRKAPTAAELQAMPPEAQQSAANAQKAGDVQSQRMREMAEAQRKAGGR